MPWVCSQDAFLFQSPDGLDGEHLVQQVDLVTGENHRLGETADQVNAVGYNVADDFNYAWNIRTSTLVRISADLSLIDLGVPANTPAAYQGINYNSGAFGVDGRLLIMNNQNGRWIEIDLTDRDAPVAVRWNVAPAPANGIRPGDLAVVDGTFYGVSPHNNQAQPARLVSFDPGTNSWVVVSPLPALASGSTFGAAYTDDVHLFVSRNQDGGIYRVDPLAPAGAFRVADGPISSVNDGARCRTQTIPTVTVVKEVGGRLVPADQFTVALERPDGTVVASATTTGTDTSAATIDQPVQRGVTYTIRDSLAPGSVSDPASYTASIACTADGSAVPAPPPAFIGAWTLTIGDADTHVCTVTNTPDAPAPALDLVKSVSPSGPGALTLDNVLTYTFLVTNTGNVPVSGVSIDEVAFSGSDPLPPATCTPTDLDPREQSTCTTTYVVTQDDVDATELTNTAVATGLDPGGATVASDPDSVALLEPAGPVLEIEKSAFPPGVTHAGEVVTFTFRVTNAGNVTISDVAVEELAFDGSGATSAVVCEATTLAPGASTDCEATYAVTQQDVDGGGPITNVAQATGTAPDSGDVTSPPDSAEVVVLQSPYLTLVKTAAPTLVDAAGDVVTYAFQVGNQGNTTLDAVAVVEVSFSGSGSLGAPACGTATLPPGGATTCSVDYAVTATDIAAGQVLNTAVATATAPGDVAVSSAEDDAVVGVLAVEALTLLKTADPVVVGAAGESVTFSFLVTNVGNQPLADVTVDEVSFDGTGTVVAPSCPSSTLAVGASMTCTATYVVVDTDLGLGVLRNTATASGTGTSGERATSAPSSAEVGVPSTPPAADDDPAVDAGGGTLPGAGDPSLARTGTDAARLLRTGLLVLAVGAALAVLGRRPTRA